jgi:hypothetical protein
LQRFGVHMELTQLGGSAGVGVCEDNCEHDVGRASEVLVEIVKRRRAERLEPLS